MSDPAQNQYPFVDRRDPRNYVCKHEAEIKHLANRDEDMIAALKKMEDKFDGKLDLILFQMNKIPVLEEKHVNQAAELKRAHERIGQLEASLDTLSKETRDFISHVRGMGRSAWALWGGLGAMVAGLFVKVVFFSVQHGMTP